LSKSLFLFDQKLLVVKSNERSYTKQKKEGTDVRINLIKCMERNQLIDLMYMDSKGNISQRRVKVLKIHGDTFQVFCFKRNAKRTFIIDSVLACIPIIHKEIKVV